MMNVSLMRRYERPVLIVEFAALFVVAPLLILALRERAVMIAALWAGGLVTWWYLRRYAAANTPAFDKQKFLRGLRQILLRFAVIAPVISVAVWLIYPDQFLSFPRRDLAQWFSVMMLYPILSVWPQEIIYRAFLHARYRPLWKGNDRAFVIASAAAFGFMHVIFLNVIAVIMTAFLGYMLARDYAHNRSVALVCIEHALYGCLIFTVGLGMFFYSGAAWQ